MINIRNNINAIRLLSFLSLILTYILFILKINNINNNLIDSFIVSFITGCFVSIVIAYIDYKDKFDETVTYFLNEIQAYHFELSMIERHLNNCKKNKELIQAIRSDLSAINDKARKKREQIDLCFLVPTISKSNLLKTINDIYEITFGIELYSVDLYVKASKKANVKQVIETYAIIVKNQKEIIDKTLLDIKQYNISKYWRSYLKFIKQRHLI